ncbi:hypothetical protein [Devosia sp. DBB001]|nr:hypothetical protein [Devosia sp. DBB001]
MVDIKIQIVAEGKLVDWKLLTLDLLEVRSIVRKPMRPGSLECKSIYSGQMHELDHCRFVWRKLPYQLRESGMREPDVFCVHTAAEQAREQFFD